MLVADVLEDDRLRLEVVEVVVIVNALFDLRAELLAGAGDKVKRVVKDFINLINFTLFP